MDSQNNNTVPSQPLNESQHTQMSYTADPVKVNKTPTMPKRDIDIQNVAMMALEKWKESGLTLLHCTPADFEEKITAYTASLNEKTQEERSFRPTIDALKKLDEEINLRVEDVKVYIKAHKGAHGAEQYFEDFGIVKTNRSYKLPPDREARLKSLKEMVVGFQSYEINHNRYNGQYWKGILEQYEELLSRSRSIEGNMTSQTSQKNVLKQEIKAILNSLVKLVEANYPTTYKGVLRSWGFLKNRY